MRDLSGILPALVTPLNDDESLRAGSLEKLMERVYAEGADGLYLCGNTGEGVLLPVEVREQVAEIGVRCSPPSKQVVIHVGAHRTSDALRLTRHAGRIGASAISSLPPGVAFGFAETKSYYESIAAASDVPVLVYHFPALSPPFTLDQIEELCEIPGVTGIKFTSFDLFSLRQLRLGGRAVFNGHDEVLAAGLLMGAVGGIGSTYNLMTSLFAKILACAAAGQWKEALAVQDRVNRLIRVLLGFPLIPAIKHLLDRSGIPCGQAICPRRSLTPQEKVSLEESFSRWEQS